MKLSSSAAYCLLTSVLVTVFVARDAARAGAETGAEKGNASDAEELRRAVVAAFPERFSGPIGEPNPPVGSIVAWPVDTIPDGWHVCDGTPLRDCQELRQLLGLTYRPQDDINRTQRLKDAKLAGEEGVVWLPDFRGYFLRGLAAGMSEPMGKAQADEVGKLTVSEHQLTLSGAGKEPGERFVVGHGENAKGRVLLNMEGETRPKNYAVHWIIRISASGTTEPAGNAERGTEKAKGTIGEDGNSEQRAKDKKVREALLERAKKQEVQDLLRPFLSRGFWQPTGFFGKKPTEKIPMSLNAIKANKALEDTMEGAAMLANLACNVANDRPHWDGPVDWRWMIKWLQEDQERLERVKQAQKLLRELGDLMVEEKMLWQ